jgi:DNA-binding CsgD family transcriptional regulator
MIGGLRGVAGLEERGLVSVVEADGHRVIIPSHPMYGEILAMNLAESHRLSSYRNLVATAIALDSFGDVLQIASWQARCGEILSAEIALAGAGEALVRHNPALAETLVRPLGSDDVRAVLILGQALSYQQRFTEAEELIGSRSHEGSPLEGEIVSIRAQNLAFGLGRTTEARELLQSASMRIHDSATRARLNNERAMVSAISGDFVDARTASNAVLSDEESDDLAKLAAYVTLTVALAMTADCDGMEAVAGEAVRLALAHQTILPFATDQIQIMQLSAHTTAGRIAEAMAMAEMVIERGDRGNVLTPTWLSAWGLAMDLAGKQRTAAARARSAIDLYQHADPFGLETQTRGLLSLVLAQTGDKTSSQPIRDIVIPTQAPRLTVWVDRGKAWSAVLAGDLDHGAKIAVDGGRHAAGKEHFAWAALCFHDAVRMGRPAMAIDDLTAIDDSRGARLISLMKGHGTALLAEDPAGVAAAATGFGSLGAPLLAAEAWAQAAVMLEGTEPTEAARACALSIANEQLCEKPDTPALRARPLLVSGREVQVAVEAAGGLTSAEIAGRLFISRRTVDNHLRSVYRKVGITGRDELAALLAAVD